MSNKHITPDQLADSILEALKGYTVEVDQKTKAIITDVSKTCAKDVKANARNAFGNGRYARGWGVKKMFESSTDIRYVIRNSTDWQLAHLLEYGHDKWLWGKHVGGMVRGRAHIRPAYDAADKALEHEFKVRLSR